MQFDLREIYDTANQNNVAIYAVDPRGLPRLRVRHQRRRRNCRPTTSTSTRRWTRCARWREHRRPRDRQPQRSRDAGMKQIVRDSSAYYLIGYNSTQAPSDGKFHEIKVRVKRPGRAGPRAQGLLGADRRKRRRARWRRPSPAAQARRGGAGLAVNQPTRARVVRTWIGTSRGENGKTKVTFVWEPVPKAPGDRQAAASEQPARVSLMAVGADGAPYFRGRVPALASARPRVAAAGAAAAGGRAVAPSRVTFEVKPGQDAAAPVGRRRRRAGPRFGGARHHRARSHVAADDARHARGVAGADAARLSAAQGGPRRRAGRDARVQPHRSRADPRGGLRTRGYSADGQGAPVEPDRSGDERPGRHASRDARRIVPDRSAAQRPCGRRLSVEIKPPARAARPRSSSASASRRRATCVVRRARWRCWLGNLAAVQSSVGPDPSRTVRVDVIATDARGRTVRESQAGRFRAARGRRPAIDRRGALHQDRQDRRPGRSPASNPVRRRRAEGGRASERPTVCDLHGRVPRERRRVTGACATRSRALSITISAGAISSSSCGRSIRCSRSG